MDHRPPVGLMCLPLNNNVGLDRCQAISAKSLAKTLAGVATTDRTVARDSLLQLFGDGGEGGDRFLSFHGIPLLFRQQSSSDCPRKIGGLRGNLGTIALDFDRPFAEKSLATVHRV